MTLFEAISEPNRRAILLELASGERTVNELVDEMGLSQPLTSRHLRILREAGLVEARVDGQRRPYRLVPGGMAELENWLNELKSFWNQKLDSLEEYLEKMQ